MCDLIHAETAEVYYLAARTEVAFMNGFYGRLATRCGIESALRADWTESVTAQVRTVGTLDYIFLQNYTDKEQLVMFEEPVCELEGAPVGESLAADIFDNEFAAYKIWYN